jgi:hypothetical protein
MADTLVTQANCRSNITIWKQCGAAWCMLHTGLLNLIRSLKHDFGEAARLSPTG